MKLAGLMRRKVGAFLWIGGAALAVVANAAHALAEPWQLNMGMQFGYDVTPRVHVVATLANILNQCFGGTPMPWTAAYKPNNIDCAYAPNGFYYVGGQPGAG